MGKQNINSKQAFFLLEKLRLNKIEDIKEYLINIIKKDDMSCTDLIVQGIITDRNERLKLIKYSINRIELIRLIKEKKLTNEEIDIAVKNISNSNYASHNCIDVIDNITEENQKLLIRNFAFNDYKSLYNSGRINKFTPILQQEIKKRILIDPIKSYEFLIENKNNTILPEDRALAFSFIIKTGNYSYAFLHYGKPSNDERKQIIEKIATLRSYLKKLLLQQKLSMEENKLIIKIALQNQDSKILLLIYKFMNVPDKIKEPLLPYVMMSKISSSK